MNCIDEEEFNFYHLHLHAEGKTDMTVNGQESTTFIGNHTLRPDIRICIDKEDYIVDTKWKTPYDAKASVQDLRQMYTYGRYWKAKKTLLLYPGTKEKSQDYRNFVNDADYSESETFHQCKIGFVSVLPINTTNSLNPNLAADIITLLKNK